jgi:hypothetical protein
MVKALVAWSVMLAHILRCSYFRVAAYPHPDS